MGTPSEPGEDASEESVSLSKGDPTSGAPFDPYRFGMPEHPIPAEYAPPGYTGPVIPTPSPYAPPPYQQQYPYQPPSSPPPTTSQQPGEYPYPPVQPGMYGAPPPPPYHSYVQPSTRNGKATAALVLGILSIVFSWLFFFDVVFVIPGIVFGLIAMSESKARNTPGRGAAVAGLACSIVGALVATVLTVLLVHAVNKCGGLSNNTAPGFNHCVTDHFG
jgi:VanZ family protein